METTLRDEMKDGFVGIEEYFREENPDYRQFRRDYDVQMVENVLKGGSVIDHGRETIFVDYRNMFDTLYTDNANLGNPFTVENLSIFFNRLRHLDFSQKDGSPTLVDITKEYEIMKYHMDLIGTGEREKVLTEAEEGPGNYHVLGI